MKSSRAPFGKVAVVALFDTVAVDMVPSTFSERSGAENHGAAGGRTVLRANGSTLIKPGYIAVYQEDVDDGKPENENDRAQYFHEGATMPALHGRPPCDP